MKRPTVRASAKEVRLRKRRGVTLVLVAIMFTVLIGFVAMAVDFGRMYSFKAELKRLGDAAAMSATMDLRLGPGAAAQANATANVATLLTANKVEATGAGVVSAMTPYHWEFDGSPAPATRAWTAADANGVQVTVQYTANWTLARVFGSSSRVLTETSTAAFGTLTTSNCVKPWAIPYSALLAKLGYTSPYPVTTHELTAAEIAQLDDASNEVAFLDKGNDEASVNVPGNFGWVDTNLLNQPNGANNQIAASISGCTSSGIGIGTILDAEPGNRNANEIRDAMAVVCGGSSTCDSSKPPVLVPIFDQVTGTGTNAAYRVKYIGAFKLTRMDANNFYGYLTSTSVPATGPLSNAPGPVSAIILVK